jgi:small subunit ribosomal protein S6
MRRYELVFIARPDLEEEGLADAREYVNNLITSRGGEVVAEDVWGRRRLAYAIADHLEGHYVLLRFELDPPHLPELERLMRLDSRVIRHLLVRADE